MQQHTERRRLKHFSTDSQQALRDELAEMARTGSPETKLQRQREAELLQRGPRSRTLAAGEKRHPAPDPAVIMEAERALQAARTKQIALFAGLVVMMAVPVCLSATPLVIGGMIAFFGALALVLFQVNTQHRAAFVTLHMAKGLSERDANRKYDETYSGD